MPRDRFCRCDGHELVAVGEGHALDQRAVHDAEHRRREPDAEREREDGNGRQRAALPQRSGAVPDVSENGLHGGRGWGFPTYGGSKRGFRRIELQSSGAAKELTPRKR